MRRLDITSDAGLGQLAALTRRSAQDWTAVDERVDAILSDVQSRGDDAVRDWTASLDGYVPDPPRVTGEQLQEAWDATAPSLQDVLRLAADRIRRYHEIGVDQTWFEQTEAGARLGQMVTPLDRVGIYVPGGTAAYPSTVLMNVIPAQVAGVGEVALFTPAGRDGRVNPLVLAAAALLGVTEVYRVGGAQAVGAMAYGTQLIRPVDKVTGPGNAYVTRAKRQVFGTIGIDMLAGPSEVVVVADASANPDWVAADLIAQAEHDEMAAAVLVTTSAALRDAVADAVERQLATLPRAAVAGESLRRFGALVLTDTLARALEASNRLAPEHLELMVADPAAVLPSIRHAGAVFLGQSTPEALGDYLAGPNHTLPTSGTARFSSPLSVRDFQKRTSLLQLDADLVAALAPDVALLARAEGLEGHARSAEMRLA